MPAEKEELPIDARLLSEAIIELNISRRNVATYPKGHPSVERSLQRAFDLLQKLFELRAEITVAVAKDTLIIDRYFLDRKNPVYKEFAHQLNAFDIVSLTFLAGLTREELYKLHLFLAENIKNTTAQAVQEAIKKSNLVHIKVGFIDYGAFAFEEGKTEKESSSKEHLWERYVYGLKEGTLQPDAVDDLVQGVPPETLARLLSRGSASELKEETYDKVITGYLRRSSERRFSSDDLKRLLDFINGIRPELKARFLSSACRSMAHDMESAEKAFKDLSVDKVIALLDMMNKEKLTVPEALRNLLNKFSRLEAEFGSSLTSMGGLVSDDILLSPDIVELLGSGRFENFVTETYDREIQKLINFKASEVAEEKLEPYKKEFSDEYIDKDFNEVVLELIGSDFISDEEYGYFVNNILKEQAEQFIGTGQYKQLLKIFKILASNLEKNKFYGITSEAVQHFHSEEFISRFISSLRMIGRQVREEAILLCDDYGERLIPLLMDALIDEELQTTRRFIIGLITHFGDKAVPEAIKLLRDERWYVKRNMLFILAEIGGEAVLPHIRPYCRYKNPKVSFEALKYLLKIRDSHGIEALKYYLQSESKEIAERAIILAGTYKTREAVPDLIKILEKTGAGMADLSEKISLVKALGQIGDVLALDPLRKVISARSLLFKGAVEKLKEEIYITLKNYPYEAIQDMAEAGAKSKNEVIRRESLKLL